MHSYRQFVALTQKEKNYKIASGIKKVVKQENKK